MDRMEVHIYVGNCKPVEVCLGISGIAIGFSSLICCFIYCRGFANIYSAGCWVSFRGVLLGVGYGFCGDCFNGAAIDF